AEVLGLTPNKINYINLETSITPDMLPTSASRGTIIGGGAVKQAAQQLRDRLFQHAADQLGTIPVHLDARDNKIWDTNNPQRMITYKELATQLFWQPVSLTTIGWYNPPKVNFDPTTGKGSTYFTFHWMAQIFEVTIDTETGRVTVDHVYAVHDPGRVINPDMARGQILGALGFGIGYGLTEEVIVQQGVIQNQTTRDYKIMRAKDMPPVTLEFLDIADPTGPFGAKSVAEPGLDLPAGGIVNAIAHATGYHAQQIPVTRSQLLKALREGKT
ncbi:molybdopterin-dependent oxidoreductase, partial [bacterium]|nr:molybdopterin-dependent oxidoreductase [bacterium]